MIDLENDSHLVLFYPIEEGTFLDLTLINKILQASGDSEFASQTLEWHAIDEVKQSMEVN